MNWRKSVLLKKGMRYGFDVVRHPYALFLKEFDYLGYPPVLANSFPKSGTHLLIQILQALPGIRDLGDFLAYGNVKDTIESDDRKIYDATIGGKLEIFEKISVDRARDLCGVRNG